WAIDPVGRPEPTQITAASVAHAGAYLDYAAQHFERVLAGLSIDQTEADAAQIARLLVDEKPEKINERELYQRAGWSHLRDRERREKAFMALADASFIRRIRPTGYGRGRSDWIVNPSLRRTK